MHDPGTFILNGFTHRVERLHVIARVKRMDAADEEAGSPVGRPALHFIGRK